MVLHPIGPIGRECGARRLPGRRPDAGGGYSSRMADARTMEGSRWGRKRQREKRCPGITGGGRSEGNGPVAPTLKRRARGMGFGAS